MLIIIDYYVIYVSLCVVMCVCVCGGHSFSTYARKGEEGPSKSVCHAYEGGGLTDLSTCAEISLFCVFCDILICKVLLPYFVVFVDNFHYCFIKLWL